VRIWFLLYSSSKIGAGGHRFAMANGGPKFSRSIPKNLQIQQLNGVSCLILLCEGF
jgi:hypothetical protein